MARNTSRTRRGRDDDDGEEDERPTRRSSSRRGRDDDGDGDSPRRSSGRSSRTSSRGGRSRGGKFEYRDRGGEATRKRAEQSGKNYLRIVKDGVKEFKPKEGSHRIRILPPMWENAEHFGLDIWLHYNIGPDRAQVLSRAKMLDEDDPIQEELNKARKDGDEDYAKELAPKRRVGYYVIDRKNEDEGVQFWAAPWGMDRDISAQALDEDSGEALALDHPDQGYDISFRIEGKQLNTKYVGVSIARRESDLGKQQDEYLDHISENPIPDILNYLSYDDLVKLFEAGASTPRDEDDDSGRRTRKSKDRDVEEEDEDEEEERPRKKKRKQFEIDDVEEKQEVLVVVDGEEFEGEVLEVGRRTFVLETEDGEEEFKFSEVDEAELL